MRCDECGKEFRSATTWQHFCSPRCRNTHNNRENRRAAEEAKREQYRAEVAAHEALINGYTLLELKANPPPQLTGPKLLRRPVVVQPKNEEDEQQVVPQSRAVEARILRR
jgi:hypothetical protein